MRKALPRRGCRLRNVLRAWRRGTLAAGVVMTVLVACSAPTEPANRPPDPTEGLRTVNLELVPGEWEVEQFAKATTPAFADYMFEELMFAPGDCGAKALIHRMDLGTGWAEGRMDSLCSKHTWFTVWKPDGTDWWQSLGSFRSKYPRCKVLHAEGVPVSFYAAGLTQGKCKDQGLIDYAAYRSDPA